MPASRQAVASSVKLAPPGGRGTMRKPARPRSVDPEHVHHAGTASTTLTADAVGTTR